MVADIDPHVIGITESWANEDIVDAELALTGYVMFRKDRRERRGGGVILYIKESIQAYEITLKSEADSVEAIWCNIVTRNSTLTIGVVYRSPNIGQEEDVKLQKAIREVSRPVSLTSVVCKLLETLIRDHMVEFLVKHKLINKS